MVVRLQYSMPPVYSSVEQTFPPHSRALVLPG
jgi:hypothetical protein